eukprot:Blabericola_migrator_1__11405@NODE_676_length_6914_cov_416_476705_g490_i0_p1_GENE_NODE_676_length_6914_cov_416_476705_g490_i0NODE_676_length_6914_cov_416_476705_g490_i0_p1_ORF_typecomplete_len718_score119_75Peptidase_S8/PF00082_22/1_7e26DUF916/PF06030_12/49DUF916/PF06030_12/7_9e03DUF916/PF06030_12/0_52_NODE_676_length_6914_cov_416_476705_g490_i038996052
MRFLASLSYLLLLVRAKQRISVCPDRLDVVLETIHNATTISLQITNIGDTTAVISLWANDTFNDQDAELWRKGMLVDAAKKLMDLSNRKSEAESFNPVHGLIENITQYNLTSSLSETVTPNKFLVHLVPTAEDLVASVESSKKSLTSVDSLVNSVMSMDGSRSFDAPKNVTATPAPRLKRGKCVLKGHPKWGTKIHCPLKPRPRHRKLIADSTPTEDPEGTAGSTRANNCIPKLKYFRDTLWEATVPKNANCTVKEVNEYIEELKGQVDVLGIEQDIERKVDPNITIVNTPTTIDPPQESKRRLGATTEYTYDPTMPPSEWMYSYVDSAYQPFVDMNLTGIRTELALPITKPVTVMVIDTAADLTHADLLGGWYVNEAELNGQPGVDDDGDGVIDNIYGLDGEDIEHGDPPMNLSTNSHGTAVSSVIVATPNNGIGTMGVSPHVRVIPCSAGLKSISVLGSVNCMKYALDNAKRLNIRVVNHSYSGDVKAGSELEMHKQMAAAGIVSTIASANEHLNYSDPEIGLRYPVGYLVSDQVFNIVPVPRYSQMAFTDCGFAKEWMDFLVQGDWWVTGPLGSGEGVGSGTSFASPAVAGVIANMFSMNPRLNHYDIKWILRHSLNLVDGFEDYCKYGGYPNADKALRYAIGTWARPLDAERIVLDPHETRNITFVINPAADYHRYDELTKKAYITFWTPNENYLNGYEKMGEIPLSLTIRHK